MESASRQAASAIEPKLLARVAKGDQQAFALLYDQSSTLLFTLAYRILNDRDEAAELLQDVYLEVWRKIAKYDVGRGSPIAWLVTLTRSRAIDRLRSRASRGQHVVADSFEHPLVSVTPDVSPNPYEARRYGNAATDGQGHPRSAAASATGDRNGVLPGIDAYGNRREIKSAVGHREDQNQTGHVETPRVLA